MGIRHSEARLKVGIEDKGGGGSVGEVRRMYVV